MNKGQAHMFLCNGFRLKHEDVSEMHLYMEDGVIYTQDNNEFMDSNEFYGDKSLPNDEWENLGKNEKIGFLEPDGTFTKCGYGEHSVYALKLVKKLKLNEYSDGEQEVLKAGVLRIHRGWFVVPDKISLIQHKYIVKNFKNDKRFKDSYFDYTQQLEYNMVKIYKN